MKLKEVDIYEATHRLCYADKLPIIGYFSDVKIENPEYPKHADKLLKGGLRQYSANKHYQFINCYDYGPGYGYFYVEEDYWNNMKNFKGEYFCDEK